MSAATVSQVLPNFPSLMPSMVSKVRILSICPVEKTKTQPMGMALFTFKADAQPRDGYQIITVADTYQLIPDGFEELSDSNPTAGLKPAPIPARVIANSLVTEWNASISPRGNFGFYVMPDDMEEGSPQFKEVLRSMTSQVATLAEWAISDAGDKEKNGERKYISSFHRDLAKWYYGDQAIALSWFNAQTVEAMKKCLKCGESIRYEAKGCRHCGVDLVEYFLKYNFRTEDDPIVAAVARRVSLPNQTEASYVAAQTPPLSIISNLGANMPAEARVMLVNALSGEQKAEMTGKKGQNERDNYLIELIPELCARNRQLMDQMLAKGYVVSNAN